MSSNGFVQISMPGVNELKKEMESTKENAKKALKNTARDISKRAPGWIASEVVSVYNIKKGEIMPANKSAKRPQKKAGGVLVKGETIENIAIVYTGKTLTPTHFGMTPKRRPVATKDDNRKAKKKAKPYEVSAEILKGSRKRLGSQVFLGGNKGTGEIPFQRKGETRLPIAAVKTLSVPQMVTSDRTKENINSKINDGLSERLNYHMSKIK